MKDIISQISEQKMLVKLNKELYEKMAVMTAAYKFTDLCTILIEPVDEFTVGVYFESKNNNINIEKISKEFCNEVLDQQVRLDIEKKYGNIRELIYQQAFAPVKNLDKEIKI